MVVTMRAIANQNISLPRSKRLSWEAHMAVPQSAEEIAKSVKNIGDMINDPFLILKKAILQSMLSPEIIRVAHYIMIVLTTAWNLAGSAILVFTVFKLCKISIFILERISWCIFGGIKKKKPRFWKSRK